MVQCFECKGYGRLNCKKKKFCNYCKRNGHIISECTRRPRRKQGHALQAKTNLSFGSTPPNLSPEQIKQMIQSSDATAIASALFAVGITRNSIPTLFTEQTIPWYIDSGASNHMTSVQDHTSHLTPYSGKMHILAADGKKMPISCVGSLSICTSNIQNLSSPNVYFVPQLATNLLLVGQLVENNYVFHFSSSGCVVQDQRTGKVIGKGHKEGGSSYSIPHYLSLSLQTLILIIRQ